MKSDPSYPQHRPFPNELISESKAGPELGGAGCVREQREDQCDRSVVGEGGVGRGKVEGKERARSHRIKQRRGLVS